jgi:hypothetical protein
VAAATDAALIMRTVIGRASGLFGSTGSQRMLNTAPAGTTKAASIPIQLGRRVNPPIKPRTGPKITLATKVSASSDLEPE